MRFQVCQRQTADDQIKDLSICAFWIVKGTLRRLRRYRITQAPKRITELRRRVVRLTGALQGKDEAHQFLGGVGDGDIVMLAFRPLFRQISGEGSIPMADVLCGVVERIAKVTGATFLHVRIGVVQFARLVSGRGKACIGEDLIRGIEAGEIADLSEDHSAHAVADTGNGEDGRSDLVHDLLKGSFDLADLSVEFMDEADSMLKFERFGGHGGANGAPGGIAKFNGFGTAIVPLGSGGEEVGEVREMAGSDLL